MTSKKSVLIFTGLGIAILVFFYYSHDRTIAQVGDFTISESMVNYREKVANVFYPNEKTKVGLNQLVRFYTFAQILKNSSQPVTEGVLSSEEKRIEVQTQDPKTLAKIKEIFGKDHEAYIKVFILPSYVDRTIYYDFFLKEPQIQNPSHERAQKLFEKVKKDPSSLISEAKEQKLNASILEISKDSGITWKPYDQKKLNASPPTQLIDQSHVDPERAKVQTDFKKRMAAVSNQETERWIHDVVNTTEVKSLFKNIVELETNWTILRRVKNQRIKNSEIFRFEAISVPKAEFSSWFESEKAKVKVEIKH